MDTDEHRFNSAAKERRERNPESFRDSLSALGRVALLGIAQRRISISSNHFQKLRKLKKAFPTTAKMPDVLQAKQV